ncbi:transcriptional regulator [Isoalcanivorax pacificus W11-5]|uniref:Transcriptional regulator n=1 Tax=Isoalcanivorax pacificus W11-5 TaxID=391936 RepID=A0A0B4XNW7_9GAMM|nr:SMC-Scp complex subunit ScpB [Isoalcanivorax pacificus]AJD47962.1 transcriptional regulator [Isoalcanivorax pacificus W11-5]
MEKDNEVTPVEADQIKRIVEAAIFAADAPLDRDALLMLFDEADRPDKAVLGKLLEELVEDYAERGVELREVASGFRFQARKEVGPWVSRLWQEKAPRYSRAILETLALMAYRQPITRGEIEEIRGVAVSTHIIKTLLERGWARVVGHRDVPGRPAMYATTRQFLDYFDLKSLEDLPSLAEIKDLDKLNQELALDDRPPEAAPAQDGDDESASGQEDTGEGSAPPVQTGFDGLVEEEPDIDESDLMDMDKVDALLAEFDSQYRKKPASPKEAIEADGETSTAGAEKDDE